MAPNPACLLLSILLAPCLAAWPGADPADAGALTAAQEPSKELLDEYSQRYTAAAGDVAKLWALKAWCDENSLKGQAKEVCRAVLKLDDTHTAAHEALGHVLHEGKWYTSQKKLDDQLREQEEKLAREKGLVKFRDQWVEKKDVPYLQRGMVKDESGSWVSAEDAKKLAEGYVRQDLTWIAPEDKDKIAQGLYKCGEDWKPLAEADKHHSKLGQWWKLGSPSGRIVLYSTLPRAKSEEALGGLERSFGELRRFFGEEPALPLLVVIVNSIEQYNQLAAGDQTTPPVDMSDWGASAFYGAFPADGFVDPELGGWVGAGISYWDLSDSKTELWGWYYSRHALGLAYAESMDGSPESLSLLEKGQFEKFSKAFWSEKKFPYWLRFGAAEYADRYFPLQGDDPWQLRRWSIGEIVKGGGLGALDSLFKERPDSTDPDAANHFLLQAGLLAAFIADGECKAVREAHAGLQLALKEQKGVEKAVEKLEKALSANEKELHQFAGF